MRLLKSSIFSSHRSNNEREHRRVFFRTSVPTLQGSEAYAFFPAGRRSGQVGPGRAPSSLRRKWRRRFDAPGAFFGRSSRSTRSWRSAATSDAILKGPFFLSALNPARRTRIASPMAPQRGRSSGRGPPSDGTSRSLPRIRRARVKRSRYPGQKRG